MKKIILLVSASFLCVNQANAGEDGFAEGKQLFQDNCLTCHDAQLDPPQAPPMFAVQKRYKMATENKEGFIQKVTSFVTHPSKDKALLGEPVKMLGLMPQLDFEKKDVLKIAAYIHDESFAPPCNHWKAAAERFKKAGEMKMYRSHQKRYDMMCQQQPGQTMKSSEGESLKLVMQQLQRDATNLSEAILMEDFAGAEKAALAIAHHDKAPMVQKKKLKQALGQQMKAFKQADMEVHGLALSIADAAKKKDMKTLIQRQSQMVGACMSCHSVFRKKAIEILY